MSGLLLVGVRWRDKKAGTRVVGCRPDFFLSGDGEGIPTSHSPHTPPTGAPHLTLPISPPHLPIPPHIDEDALEGLYFAFYPIHVLLPYFSPYRRPRGSCELLEAFLSSCGECGVLPHLQSHPPPPHHPPSHTPTPHALPHLTPHRRGCPRRALFRVLSHPCTFTLFFAISPS